MTNLSTNCDLFSQGYSLVFYREGYYTGLTTTKLKKKNNYCIVLCIYFPSNHLQHPVCDNCHCPATSISQAYNTV